MSRYRLWFIAITVTVAAASLAIAFHFLNPTPPNRVVMATGPAGSTYAEMAEAYRELLAEDGVTVDYRQSGGARDNLSLLSDPDGDVDVGFVTLGTPDSSATANVESLGAMFLEPLWVFTTDEEVATGDISRLPELRVSIGPAGSRTNAASRYLFGLLGLDAQRLDIAELDPARASNQLLAGDVDIVMLVSKPSTPSVRELLSTPVVSLVDFERADAYAALFPELKKLVVPAGVGSLKLNLPDTDKRILSFTSILAVREDLHPAVQSLLIDAATRIHASPDIFHAEARFPNDQAIGIPLSQSALRFYRNGMPLLHRFLPFWLAVLVMQVFVAAIPLLGVVYPMVKVMPKAFDWVMRRRIYRLYQSLKRIEQDGQAVDTDDETIRSTLDKLDALDRRVSDLRLPVTYSTMIYALKSHINVVRMRVNNM